MAGARPREYPEVHWCLSGGGEAVHGVRDEGEWRRSHISEEESQCIET